MKPVFVDGIGITRFGKDPRPLPAIFCDAARQALESGRCQDVDAIFIGVMAAEEFTGDGNIASCIADALGLTGRPAVRIETASSSGAAALYAGVQAIASGCHRRVLVVAGEKMTHFGTRAATRVLAGVLDREERQCGATMPALAAMIAEKYRQHFRLSRSRMEAMLCAVALKNHLNASHNPLAHFRNAVTREMYLASDFVATPLRRFDCAPITDGAAALVLTAERTDVRLSGIGQGTGPVSMAERETFVSFPATRIAAARAYRMAETSPEGIDIAEVHDAFTPFEIISTEDLGFFPPGKGGEAALAGKTALDGPLPVNASGGLKARGHPVGASGLAQVVEIAKALRGHGAGNREFMRGLAQSTGGLATNNFVTILERAGARAVHSPGLPAALEVPVDRPKKAPRREPAGSEGEIETFTVLHVTPEGFSPPLALALIRDHARRLVIAQGKDSRQLKIGREVYLRRGDGFYVFKVKSRLEIAKEAVRKLLQRGLRWRRPRLGELPT
ncbi:MAG TPA: beta-ketoacyl synthase N-terminal-like domain-containing protein [candidate division Zixibacteria bacterium]|nr:beta-ketoacyl synthase N-terminal-like domain-containing protein [candidate division Zixibacteria bacterium]